MSNNIPSDFWEDIQCNCAIVMDTTMKNKNITHEKDWWKKKQRLKQVKV